jgi:hypothetical protein
MKLGQMICFSHLRWDFVWQRPQHLISRAANEFEVYYVEEPVFSDEMPHLNVSPRHDNPENYLVQVVVPVLPRGVNGREADLLQQRLLSQRFAATSAPRVTWYYTPAALSFSGGIRADAIVYDNMDELSAFLGAPQGLLDLETTLFGLADVVFTGGESLYAAKRHRHLNIHAVPSSVDTAHFGKARTLRVRQAADPADQASIGFPRVGFFGVIDERMDLALVQAIATRRPDWQLVMLGPVAKIDRASLPQAQNIHWLGAKPYLQLPAYLQGWQAGFMPFAINEATRFISPTKTPEFLAAGLPVVSTPVQDVVHPYGKMGLVEIAGSASEAIAALDLVMGGRPANWATAVAEHLAKLSWDKTWEFMRGEILSCLEGPSKLPVPGPAKDLAHA